MKITQNQIEEYSEMLRDEYRYGRFANRVYIAQYKIFYTENGNRRMHVKVFIVDKNGIINNITRYVGIIGGWRFVAGNSLISICDPDDVTRVVKKVLDVDFVNTEVI